MNWHEILTGWDKSSYTHHEENACVEIAHGRDIGVVGVRDTKQAATPSGLRPVLVFGAAAFGGLLDAVTH